MRRTVPDPLHELPEAEELLPRGRGEPVALDDRARRVLEALFDGRQLELAHGVLRSGRERRSASRTVYDHCSRARPYSIPHPWTSCRSRCRRWRAGAARFSDTSRSFTRASVIVVSHFCRLFSSLLAKKSARMRCGPLTYPLAHMFSTAEVVHQRLGRSPGCQQARQVQQGVRVLL